MMTEQFFGRAARNATRTGFFIAGFAIAAWAPLVPYVKMRAQLNEDTLGLLLLCLGIGSVIAMPIGSALAERYGCRRILIAASLLVCTTLPVLGLLSNFAGLAVALFIFGAGMGSLDCVVNMQAIIVERDSDRPLMSGFHAQFSVGGIVGALGVSLFLTLGLSPLSAMICVAGAILVVALVAAPYMVDRMNLGSSKLFAVPHGVVLLIGAVCFTCFLAEGAMLDWSAVFLTEIQKIETSLAGLGYAAFATAMTIGRLTGDRLVHRFGHSTLLLLGALVASGGLIFSALTPRWSAAIVGYGLVGFGCSNIVPIMYSLVGKQKIMSQSAAVAAITSMGYAGILVGPAVIGFVAERAGLPVSFVLVALLLGLTVGVFMARAKI